MARTNYQYAPRPRSSGKTPCSTWETQVIEMIAELEEYEFAIGSNYRRLKAKMSLIGINSAAEAHRLRMKLLEDPYKTCW